MILTKSQANFIGHEFVTKQGGILKIVDVDPNAVVLSQGMVFIGECSICSLDVELWPHGSIIAPKASYVKGFLPCGCSNNCKWKPFQKVVKIQRVCDELNYELKSFDTTTNDIILHNPVSGNTWKSGFVRFCSRKQIDPSLVGDLLRKQKLEMYPDSYHIVDFMKTGVYHKDTTFTRNSENAHYWDVCCGRCTVKYTKHRSNLKIGQLGCACFDKEKSNRNGYYPKMKSMKDYLYVLDFGGKFLKVGRSFNVTRRIRHMARYSNMPFDEIKILRTYTSSHENIYSIEQIVLTKLKQASFSHETNWSQECFRHNVQCLEQIYQNLNEFFEKVD